MEQKLFTESRMLYAANKDNPFIIRIKMQMDDIVDSDSIGNGQFDVRFQDGTALRVSF